MSQPIDPQSLATALIAALSGGHTAPAQEATPTVAPAPASADIYHAFRLATGCGNMTAWRAFANDPHAGRERRAFIASRWTPGATYRRDVEGKAANARTVARACFQWGSTLDGLADTLRSMQPEQGPAPSTDPHAGGLTDPRQALELANGNVQHALAAMLFPGFAEAVGMVKAPAPTQVPDVTTPRRPWLTALNGIRGAYRLAGEPVPTVSKAHALYAEAVAMAQEGHPVPVIADTLATHPIITGKGRRGGRK